MFTSPRRPQPKRRTEQEKTRENHLAVSLDGKEDAHGSQRAATKVMSGRLGVVQVFRFATFLPVKHEETAKQVHAVVLNDEGGILVVNSQSGDQPAGRAQCSHAR